MDMKSRGMRIMPIMSYWRRSIRLSSDQLIAVRINLDLFIILESRKEWKYNLDMNVTVNFILVATVI